MNSKSNNKKFTSSNDANEVVAELFDSIRPRYQNSLETPMRRKEITFD